MPLLTLILIAAAAGFAARFVALRLLAPARSQAPPVAVAEFDARAVVSRHPRLAAALAARSDPAAATGLALTIAVTLIAAGGLMLAMLAYLVRTNAALLTIDNSVARWGDRNATAFSSAGLDAVTQLGSTSVVIALALALAVFDAVRHRNLWAVPFLALVIGVERLLTTTIKDLADRARPAFDPVAETLGPSFPSGHTAAAAAFFAAAALLIGRDRSRASRAALAGMAVTVAVAVAASRVMLDVHWFSDVIAGLALGWAWFVVCALAFGGRLLRFGAPAQIAAAAMQPARPSPPPARHASAPSTRPRVPR